MLKRINESLPELLLGILVYGLVIQGIGIWFVQDKLSYTIGLWLGIIVAVGMAIHMAIAILDAVDMVIEKKARMKATISSILRYVVVVIVFLLASYFELGNIIMMFVGVMGLKIAAYFWPFTHKFISKFKREEGDDISTDQ